MSDETKAQVEAKKPTGNEEYERSLLENSIPITLAMSAMLTIQRDGTPSWRWARRRRLEQERLWWEETGRRLAAQAGSLASVLSGRQNAQSGPNRQQRRARKK